MYFVAAKQDSTPKDIAAIENSKNSLLDFFIIYQLKFNELIINI